MIYNIQGDCPGERDDRKKKPRPCPIKVPFDASLPPGPAAPKPHSCTPRKKMSVACERKVWVFARKSDLYMKITTLLFLTCAEIVWHSGLISEMGRPSPEWIKMEELAKLVANKDASAYGKLVTALGECRDRKAVKYLGDFKKMEKMLSEYNRLTEEFPQ